MSWSAAAIEILDKAYEFSGGNTIALAIKGYVLARSGRHSEAERIVSGLIQTGKAGLFRPPMSRWSTPDWASANPPWNGWTKHTRLTTYA
jgi:hypothetical protein